LKLETGKNNLFNKYKNQKTTGYDTIHGKYSTTLLSANYLKELLR
jgi:hypothetical protein